MYHASPACFNVKLILKLLHSSHSGITKTTNLLLAGMTNDIKQQVSACRDCVRVLQSQRSNPMVTAAPSSHFGFPMQHVGLDLFPFGGKDYLICVDNWSGYPLYRLLRSLISDAILKVLTNWFNMFGWSSFIRSDGGPQFRGNFPKLCKNMTSGMNYPLCITPRATASPRRE